MNVGVPILLERDNVNDDVVVLAHWFVKDGGAVDAGTLIAEIETSKANVEVLAPHSGYLHWGFAEKAELPLSDPIGHILPEPLPEGSLLANSSKSNTTPPSQQSATSKLTESVSLSSGGIEKDSSSQKGSPVFTSSTGYIQQISHKARELMKAHDLAVDRFAGIPLVRADDVLEVLHGKPVKKAGPVKRRETVAQGETERQPQSVSRLPFTEVPLSRMKRSEAKSLAGGAKNTISSSVSVTCLTRGLRTALEADPAMAGNVGSLIVYECARLLRKYPSFNATHDSGMMLSYDQVNIGYAVDDGRGLKVVVLRDCDRKSLQEITAELRELVLNYLEDKLTPTQISDGTFTISDLSGNGVSSFAPLISEGQSAILGVGGEQFVAGSRDGFYTLTLGFDHQLSEGRSAALFLNDLKDRLLNYEKAVLREALQPEAIVCVRCGRGSADLPDEKSYMVQSVVPPGYLCNICMVGL